MAAEKITEKSRGYMDVSTAIAQNVINRPLIGKAYLICPALPKGNSIHHEIREIQKKFSALRIDLRWRQLPLSRSKKRRLRKKRQELARLNKSTIGLEELAENPLVVQNTMGEVNVINCELNRKDNSTLRKTLKETAERNKSVRILSSKESRYGLQIVAENPALVENTVEMNDCISDGDDANVITSANRVNHSNEYMQEKDNELLSRKRKQCMHSLKSESELHSKKSKSAIESEMSAKGQIKAECSSKSNELTTENSMNNELSTHKGEKIELLRKNATIDVSKNASARDNELSAQKDDKTNHCSKHKSKSSMSITTKDTECNIKTKITSSSFVSKLYRNKLTLYSFEVTGSSNLLPTGDIMFLLKLQNSMPINKWIVESRKEITKDKSLITVGVEPATAIFLEKTNLEVSLLRSKVTFVERKLIIIPLYSRAKPFLWLGKWREFKTVLNEKSDKNK